MNPINFLSNDTINPYFNGLQMLKNRLLWDLKLESWRSRKKIRTWQNKYAGQKAVILCNGPSLLKSELSLLQNTFTFGLNKINLLFEQSHFRPSCIVAVNRHVIEQNKSFYNTTDIPLFLDSYGSSFIKKNKDTIFLHSTHQMQFAKNCSMSIHQGATVTYVALQLAYHMGFTQVALIGCDHYFSTVGPANKLVASTETDPNHFDHRYFSGGVKWQLPDLLQSEVSYLLAKKEFTNDNRLIFNATEGGALELFQRISLVNFLNY